MTRIRQQNVTAAQWTSNGSAMGAADLTSPGSYPYGENVFNLDVQRKRLPKDVFKRLLATLHRGEALDISVRGPPCNCSSAYRCRIEARATAAGPPYPHGETWRRSVRPRGRRVRDVSTLGRNRGADLWTQGECRAARHR